jgi:hypothetical protein
MAVDRVAKSLHFDYCTGSYKTTIYEQQVLSNLSQLSKQQYNVVEQPDDTLLQNTGYIRRTKA